MEMQNKAIYYITTGTLPEGAKEGNSGHCSLLRKKESMLPVFKCGRSFLYAGGKPSAAGNPVAAGAVQIYFSILPENVETELKKTRRRKKWLGRLAAAMDYAEKALGCTGSDDILFSEGLCRIFERQQSLPLELYGILLWTGKKRGGFKKLGIALPAECNSFMTESIIALLEPYLAGVNTVSFAGRATKETQVLEEYFYDEYGIVADYEKGRNENAVWLNFENKGEILKFLDTTIKSGYNTKVN